VYIMYRSREGRMPATNLRNLVSSLQAIWTPEVTEEDWRIANTQRLLPAVHARLGRWPITVSQRLAGMSTPCPRPPREVVRRPRVGVNGLSSNDRLRSSPSSPA